MAATITHDYQSALAFAAERCPEVRETLEALAARLRDSEPERTAVGELLVPDPDEKRSQARIGVRITRHGIRLLDTDNLAGCKPLLDQIRYAGLIPDDDPETIELELRQQKAKRKDIGTEILIEPR